MAGIDMMTPSDVAQRRRYAQALMEQGTDASPVGHWTQALARVVQGGLGGYQMGQANRGEQEGMASGNKALAQALAGGDYTEAMQNPYVADQAFKLQLDDRNYNRGAEDRQLDQQYRRAQMEALKQPKTYEVGNSLLSVAPGQKPQVLYSAPEKEDPIEAFIRQRLRGQAPVQAPTVQPQSMPGGGVGGATLQPTSTTPPQNPLLQTVADQPQGMPQQQGQQPDMVDIPMFGRMSRQEAQELGMMLQLNPKYSNLGRSIMEQFGGGGGGANLPKPAENQLAERVISSAGVLGRISDLRKQFKPEFQQIPERFKLLGASWGSSLGARLTPELEGQLRDFAKYRATAFDNFNQLLKELSGTAVSAQEFERQKVVQPNPGTGLFDGDDPVTLAAKIDQVEQIAKSAMARMNYMRNKGLNFNKDTAEQFARLEDMPAFVEKRGAEIEQELRGRGLDPMSAEKQTQQILRQEFGI